MKQLETVGWLYTHVQSGDQELSSDEDYRDAVELESGYWNKQEVVLKAAAIAAIQAQGVPDGWRFALQTIADWKAHSLELAVEHGSNGVRDFYRQIAIDALASALPAPQAIAPELDVRQIMLAIEPGPDGWGEEVYAKSVNDVVDMLTKMGQELEEWQLGIKRLPALQAKDDSADSVNDTNAALAGRYFELLKVVEQYEKSGVTCQTFRHFISEPCAECNSPGICGKQASESAACAERDARIAELERQLTAARSKATELHFALRDAWPYVNENCTITSRKKRIENCLVTHGEFADIVCQLPQP